jgi:hypothetical protein
MNKLKIIKLEQLILSTLLIYVTVHLLEEWLLGFPAWAELRWGIPGYTVFKWLLHNVYFAFFLVVGYVAYRRKPQKWRAVGVGILVWGLLNFFNHLIFTLIFLELSPGLFTGLLFLLFAILGWQRLRETETVGWRLIVTSIVFGLLYWAVPIVLFLTVDIALGI